MNLIDKVNPELKEHIVSNVFPMYALNGESHGIGHINDVIRRTFEIIEEYEKNNPYAPKLNYDLSYVVAAYHDIGDHIDRKKHHTISAKMMFEDKNLDKFFIPEEKQIAKEAIEDHRASNNEVPRSIYGRVVLTADRNNSIEEFFKRRIKYCSERHPEYTEDQVVEEIYESSVKKFGKEGYAFTKTCYMPSEKLEAYLKTINSLVHDREKFEEMTRSYYHDETKGGKDSSESNAKKLPDGLYVGIRIGDNILEHK